MAPARYKGPMTVHGPRQIAEAANRTLDAVLQRRAGISVALIANWADIAGPDFAAATRPEKIAWPRRTEGPDGVAISTQQGTLTVACEGSRALFLAHAQGELIQRVNAFFGFPAIGRIRIVQKPVAPDGPRRKRMRPLSEAQRAHVEALAAGVENEALRAAIERFGKAFYGAR